MMFSLVDTRIGRSFTLHSWGKLSNAETRLAMALSKVPTLTARYNYLEAMLSGYEYKIDKPDDDLLKLWAKKNILSALSTLSHATEEDGRTLAAIKQKYGKDFLMEE